MSDTLRTGLVAFAMAATAVIAISVVLLLATNGSDDNARAGDATSATPNALGESAGPSLTPTPRPH
jgi:hypothetical protein